MSLGHADREVVEALPRVSLYLHLGLGQQLNVIRSVDLLRNGSDLVLDAEVEVVEELEVAGGVCCSLYSLGQLGRPTASQRPVTAKNSIECSRLLGQSPDQLQLLVSVGDEDVDGDHHGDSKHVDILNLLPEIAEARLDQRDV